MRRQLIFLCFITVGVLAWAQPTSTRLATTSIQTDFNLIFLPIQINGETVHMIMDTGAGFSVIDEKVAEQLDLKIDNVRIMERPGGNVRLGSIEQLEYTIEEVQGTMPIASANLSEGGFNDYIGRPCAGILGFDFISRYAFEIDYVANTVTILDPRANRTGQGVRGEIMMREGMPVVEGLISERGQEIPGNWLIDTGSMMSVGLNESYYQKHLRHSVTPRESLAVGFGGSTPGQMYKLAGFNLLGFQFNEVVAGHAEDGINDETFDGVLGGELLSRFKIYINYTASEVYLQPNDRFEAPIRWDLSGMLLAHTAKGIEVLHVYADSPAAEVGIIAGNIIMRINGDTAEGIGLPAIWRMFHDGEKKSFRLEVRDDNKLAARTIVLRDYF